MNSTTKIGFKPCPKNFDSLISTTHLLFGISIAYALEKRILTAGIFSIVPDFDITFDFLYPFVHRGIMHSILAASVFSGIVYLYSTERASAESCFLGYCSALGLDLLTESGMPVLFPLQTDLSLGLTSAYSIQANTAIITISLGLMFLKKNQERFLGLKTDL